MTLVWVLAGLEGIAPSTGVGERTRTRAVGAFSAPNRHVRRDPAHPNLVVRYVEALTPSFLSEHRDLMIENRLDFKLCPLPIDS